MNEATQPREPSRIALVVGVDLSEVSEHLLAKTRQLIQPIDDIELHLVHVVHPDPISQRIAHPVQSPDLGANAHAQYAKWELERLCTRVVEGIRGAKVVIHTPIGDAANELRRIATEVGADLVVIEAHDHRGDRRVFHRSFVARLVRSAPCTVLTLRDPSRRNRPAALSRALSQREEAVSELR
jgi:nucleotide-binding universal stress UspA family protein